MPTRVCLQVKSHQTEFKDRLQANFIVDAPDQSWLIKAVDEKPTEKTYEAAFAHMRKIGRNQEIEQVIKEHDLDVILAPMDSPVCSLSTASGTLTFSTPVQAWLCSL